MHVIEAERITHRFGGRVVLGRVDLRVGEGSLHALIGPNGAGKTTLLRILMGLLQPAAGEVRLLGRVVKAGDPHERVDIGYVAEGQRLPGWMKLSQLEAYLAPLYPRWDAALAGELRRRFGLDPAARLRTLSRGEQMKAALLCSLAARPRVLIMDEPFTGMDVVVKDDLVRALLEWSARESWSVLLCSHDIGELEMLADHVTLLADGTVRLAASMDEVRERHLLVEAVIPGGARAVEPGDGWLAFEQSERRVSFMTSDAESAARFRSALPADAQVDVREATLREVFVAHVRDAGDAADHPALEEEVVA